MATDQEVCHVWLKRVPPTQPELRRYVDAIRDAEMWAPGETHPTKNLTATKLTGKMTT